jgi:hypothetical protein
MNTAIIKSILHEIQLRDPDGFSTEPTDGDRDAFRAWVHGLHSGADLWRIYHTAWLPVADV